MESRALLVVVRAVKAGVSQPTGGSWAAVLAISQTRTLKINLYPRGVRSAAGINFRWKLATREP